ncbi:hypothetical protein [uncultured Flavobacterium sp.]|uniref:hypothetical protein n=1 Tax=uncultured Flavobacterium sp. TaxID=165435 RepID=UPI00308153FD
MKYILLFIAFLNTGFLIGQTSILVPPQPVIAAFEKGYPQKKVIWSIEYGKGEEIYFEGTFNPTTATKGYVLYDSYGAFKSLKTEISISKLPLKAQDYLKKNYPAKGKVKSVGKILTKIDDKNNETYISEAKKDKKLYNIVFDKEGEFIKRIEIDIL